MSVPHLPGNTHCEFRSFVFDLDGTLIDSLPGIASALSAGFASIGRAMPKADLSHVIGPPIRTIARRLDPTLSDDETLAIERAYRPLYDERTWIQTTLFPGVADTLHTLHAAGHRLFLLTNKPLAPTKKILTHYALIHLFEDIATRDSTSPPASNKIAMLTSLVDRNHIDAGSAVMVGDTSEDGEAAAANGLAFAFVTYGYGEANHSDLRLDRFTDLLLETMVTR